MDFQKMVEHARSAHRPFPCSCGGMFKVASQSLCYDAKQKKMVDRMLFRCDKCDKQSEQGSDVDHLDDAAAYGV